MIRVTFTGIDHRTIDRDLQELQRRGAELAILVSSKTEFSNRYPAVVYIRDMIACLDRKQLAVHFCGSTIRKEIVNGAWDWLISQVARVQINGVVSPEFLTPLCQRFTGIEFITQNCPANALLLGVKTLNHAVLVDGSGGRGITPAKWEYPITTKPVGFAGGLGPHNIRTELPKILQASREGAWIDMETGIRTDDWFDSSKAMAVLNSVYERSIP